MGQQARANRVRTDAENFAIVAQAVSRMQALLMRGFFGRFKWLLFGR